MQSNRTGNGGKISRNYFQTKFKVIKNGKQYWNNFWKCAFLKKTYPESRKSECWKEQTLSGNKQLHDKWWATVSRPLRACLSWINLDCLYLIVRKTVQVFNTDCNSNNQIVTKWNWISQQETKICLEHFIYQKYDKRCMRENIYLTTYINLIKHDCPIYYTLISVHSKIIHPLELNSNSNPNPQWQDISKHGSVLR